MRLPKRLQCSRHSRTMASSFSGEYRRLCPERMPVPVYCTVNALFLLIVSLPLPLLCVHILRAPLNPTVHRPEDVSLIACETCASKWRPTRIVLCESASSSRASQTSERNVPFVNIHASIMLLCCILIRNTYLRVQYRYICSRFVW